MKDSFYLTFSEKGVVLNTPRKSQGRLQSGQIRVRFDIEIPDEYFSNDYAVDVLLKKTPRNERQWFYVNEGE